MNAVVAPGKARRAALITYNSGCSLQRGPPGHLGPAGGLPGGPKGSKRERSCCPIQLLLAAYGWEQVEARDRKGRQKTE